MGTARARAEREREREREREFIVGAFMHLFTLELGQFPHASHWPPINRYHSCLLITGVLYREILCTNRP